MLCMYVCVYIYIYIHIYIYTHIYYSIVYHVISLLRRLPRPKTDQPVCLQANMYLGGVVK